MSTQDSTLIQFEDSDYQCEFTIRISSHSLCSDTHEAANLYFKSTQLTDADWQQTFFSHFWDTVTPRLYVHIHWQDAEMQFYLQGELLEQQTCPVTIVALLNQIATIPHQNRIVIYAFWHRQESSHFHGYILLFGYLRIEQLFPFCTASTDKYLLFIISRFHSLHMIFVPH